MVGRGQVGSDSVRICGEGEQKRQRGLTSLYAFSVLCVRSILSFRIQIHHPLGRYSIHDFPSFLPLFVLGKGASTSLAAHNCSARDTPLPTPSRSGFGLGTFSH